MHNVIYDLIVIGGGINGAGIARDAAGRGLSVLLVEADDLASHTSSASTKLIHGGLRYLEQYEFKLVAKALSEREILLKAAPHIIWPMRFILPHQKHLRPAWMIRTGLFMYDHLGGRQTLAGSHGLKFADHPTGKPLKSEFTKGFAYSDAWVQDARLVVLNCMDAASRGACIMTRTRAEAAVRGNQEWTVTLRTAEDATLQVAARGLVNAAGPWAVRFLDDVASQAHPYSLRLIKGSHIVVNKLFDHDYAYIFQQPDGRIVFAIPYEQDFTLIGTTDVEHRGAPGEIAIEEDETDYLCESANRYFEQPIGPDDVVWSYSGVRPLLDDREDNASEITRDYRIQLDASGGAPLLSVFGGKLTTYRRLAEDAVDQLAPELGHQEKAWTGTGHPLPGGEEAKPQHLFESLQASHPFLPLGMANRMVFNYGTRVTSIVGDAKSLDELGEHFGADLYAAEVDYLRDHEWARTAEDILWRRSKLGLRLDANEQRRLADYLDRACAKPTRADSET
ncbi:homodimeric glycerol 3-phosphate dehydrogenase (quinone) [Chromohalobacter marismortui]|uniref:Glycerol-3-phosphate dehydrogenase n=1 Tax=Chromohalobacter marismortui TaxID=42055 RepID=A0A4R7NQN0_9GAMM|nr:MULTISPECIES: glycerol-3-phosphate dehydrogenase [Chromohalobacter]MCI0508816.1 glycerol-3-phosphate dehydrogenase [Chromohalobacter sp.]MCI0594327.1 glycerol-3-phosphate dehydrogenase [Chromohalobacter sp.]TDU22811.1 homodimeric glycerol 3-phosphate dehydrogenase (quinone) [Chromohalobacter marismortui]